MTLGHPGTWNDKLIVLFDELINKAQNRDVPDDYEFEFLEKDKHGNFVMVPHKGSWFMVDNSYLAWSCTVPLDNDGLTCKIIQFSE